MNMPFWQDAPDVWDAPTFLDGETRYEILGVCTIRPSKGLEVTNEPVAGQDGVQQTALRYRPAQVYMDVRVFDEAQFQRLLRIFELWRPTKGEEARAVIVTHPQLQMLGISELFISNVETTSPDASSGFLATLTLIEFTPERKRQGRAVKEVAAPSSSGGSSGDDDIPTLREISGVGLDTFLPPSEGDVPVGDG